MIRSACRVSPPARYISLDRPDPAGLDPAEGTNTLTGKEGGSGVGAILFGLLPQTEDIWGARHPLSPVVADFEAAS